MSWYHIQHLNPLHVRRIVRIAASQLLKEDRHNACPVVTDDQVYAAEPFAVPPEQHMNDFFVARAHLGTLSRLCMRDRYPWLD